MRKALALSLALSLLAVPAAPASAEMVKKAINTGINLVGGWLDCPKAYVDELDQQTWWRTAVGALVTGPVMCGTNVAVRYVGVGVDILTLPFGGNVINPAVHETAAPPLRLPK